MTKNAQSILNFSRLSFIEKCKTAMERFDRCSEPVRILSGSLEAGAFNFM